MNVAQEFKMTKEQKKQCHSIIHVASAAAGSTSFFTAQIPLADSAIIVPAQMAMVVSLAGVFGYSLSNGVAEALSGPMVAHQLGQATAKTLVGFVPVAGNITKAGISVSFTEALGWLVAQKFCEGRARDFDAGEAFGMVCQGIKEYRFS